MSVNVRRLCQAGVLAALATLVACNGATVNALQGVTLVPGQTVALDTPLKFELSGTGTCTAVDVDWGDGSTEVFNYPTGTIVLSGTSGSGVASRTMTHTFRGWRGGKTVTVKGRSGCEGQANTRFKIVPETFSIGFAQPGTQVCNTVSTLPRIVSRSLVHVTTTPVTGPYSFGIDFGCAFQGCRYDADGKPGSSAAAPFPFTGFREFSLILRIVDQVEQGGTNVQFTTTKLGPIEFCINDDSLSNNTGGYQINVGIDQLGPPATP